AVGILECRQLVLVSGRQEGGTAVGCIDVEPNPVTVTYFSNVVQRVDGSGAGRPRTGRNNNGKVAALPIAPYRFFELGDLHLEGAIDGDSSDVVTPEPQQFECLPNAGMPFGGHVGHGPALEVLHTLLANDGQLDMPGHRQPRP